MESTQENKLLSQNIQDKEPVTYSDQLPMPIEYRVLSLRSKQYRRFWYWGEDSKTVPPLLAYADLMGTADSRCLEAA